MGSLFVFAGENSGDLHGEKLIKALKAEDPHLDIWGVGGERMRAAGLRCILPMEKFQVMGFVDVFLALPKLVRLFYWLRKQILKGNPPAAVFIDYPGFNLRMEDHLRKKGYRGFLCHYICPTVWAWGKKRIPLMGKNLDLLLTILPFEAKYFSGLPLKVEYVGHPLIERIPLPLKTEGGKKIALFPGSRVKEIERNFPLFLRVAKQLLEKNPSLLFTVSLAHPQFAPLLHSLMRKENLLLPLEEDSYKLMKETHLAISKSGTITLELALHQVPTIVTYGLSPFDLFLAKNIFKIKLPFYSLPNILLEQEVFPELIGPHFTQASLLEKALKLITDPAARAACQEQCRKIRHLLGTQNTSQAAASKILSASLKSQL